MPSPSRRDVLAATAAAAFGSLAGCSGGTRTGSAPTTAPDGPPSDALVDPPAVQLRRAELALVVTDADEPTDDRTAGTDRQDPGRVNDLTIVPDADTASSLRIAPVDGADDARDFLSATDFADESVVVVQQPVRACFERRICWVHWTEDSIDTRYASRYRDASVACETDEYDVVATLLRLPVSLDPNRITTFGSGGGGHGCDAYDRRADDGTASDGSSTDGSSPDRVATDGDAA